MTVDEITEASELWHAGMTTKLIADSVGVEIGHLNHIIDVNREYFPYRNKWTRRRGESAIIAIIDETRIRWRNETGEVTTLPRVRLLEN